jgi:uncharacterized protein YqgV (UPF0045/DUF77 family)
MNIGVEISLYPLHADYIPVIQAFIDRLNTDPRLKVITNNMSTQVFGDYDLIFDLLRTECRATFAATDKSVFVMKLLGPFDLA